MPHLQFSLIFKVISHNNRVRGVNVLKQVHLVSIFKAFTITVVTRKFPLNHFNKMYYVLNV
jgi:hypothetical protein